MLTFFQKLFNLIIFLLIIGLVAFLFQNSVFRTEVGYIYHFQNLITGKIDVYSKPGIHFRIPFSFRVTPYKRFTTVAFGGNYQGYQYREPAITVRFADTYTAEILATFRYQLPPSNKGKINKIHEAFLNFDEMINALLIKISRDVVVNTATQYTGEEFFLGGFNQFKAALKDQLRNGIYKTERQQVEIEQVDLSPIGIKPKESMPHKAKTLVWKTVPVHGKDNKVVRLENMLNTYGITVEQINLGGFVPEEQLEKLLADKKRLVASLIKAMQEQEIAKEQAKTAQLRAEIERTMAKQAALNQKELAIIVKQRELEEAQKQVEKEIMESKKVNELVAIEKKKELAIAKAEHEIQEVNKKTELAIAQVERDIQKTKLETAQFEAKAVREKGIAEADILRAKYQDRITEIYLADIQKEIAQIIYPNLKGIQVTMPHNIVNLGEQDNNLQTNLDVLSSFATIGVMEGLEKKALAEKQPKLQAKTLEEQARNSDKSSR